jgi:ATP-dependent Clp protease adaptor protein ClpS
LALRIFGIMRPQASRQSGRFWRGRQDARLPGERRAVMAEKTIVKPKAAVKPKTQRPKLWKVILLNDDYTPREFVTQVLKAVFRMNADRAYHVMMTAHRRGACVIAVYTQDVADTKAKEATDLGKQNGYPLYFTTDPEE